MRLAVVGSRGCANVGRIEASITQFLADRTISVNEITIVSGGAIGVDSIAREWAEKVGADTKLFLPDYGKFPGKIAPLMRNALIAEYCDEMLAFWDGRSRGTMNAINYAKRFKKPVDLRLVEVK